MLGRFLELGVLPMVQINERLFSEKHQSFFLPYLNLTEPRKNMSLCLTTELPCIVACKTTIKNETLERNECPEILIDSTYKTDS